MATIITTRNKNVNKHNCPTFPPTQSHPSPPKHTPFELGLPELEPEEEPEELELGA